MFHCLEAQAKTSSTDEPVAVVVPAQVETPAADTLSDEDAQPEMVEESAAEDTQEQVADRPLLLAQADTSAATAEREWKFEEGRHYARMVPAQPTVGGADKVVHIGREIGVGEIAFRFAKAGKVETQDSEPFRPQRARNLAGRLDVLRTRKTMRKKRKGARAAADRRPPARRRSHPRWWIIFKRSECRWSKSTGRRRAPR